jgi:hypothetical protein
METNKLNKKYFFFLTSATPLAVGEINNETEDVVILCGRIKIFFFKC